MKILSLRFKNLNSLYGEWFIDFTDPDYELNGIFALTGPTGAGKSTILDAICLALYGATPRLGRITATANDIMSRQTGECFAEVVFASQAGVYRCRWDQRRARQQPTGNLQSQEHQIAKAQCGKLIENKVSRVVAVVEEKTGMDFERFTRSVLLAQGSFDSFLKADAEQKSKLLEQITGTEIYTEISKRVHDRLRQEKELLNHLKAEISGAGLLDTDEEQRLELELAFQEAEYKTVSTDLSQVSKAIDWLNVLQQSKQEIESLEAQRRDLEIKQQHLQPNRQRLALANQAAALDSSYAELSTLQKQQINEQKELRIAAAQLPQIEQAVTQQAEAYQAATAQVLVAKQALQDARPLWQQVRFIDQQLPKPYKQLQHLPVLSVAAERERMESWLQGRLLREYEQEKEALLREKILLTKVSQLEEERASLLENAPCPLCGATEHPYADGQAPAMDETDKKIAIIEKIIMQVGVCTENIKNAELYELVEKRRQLYGDQDPDQQERQLQQALEKAEQTEISLRAKHSALQQKHVATQATLDALQQRVRQRQTELFALRQQLSVAIQQAGFNDEASFLAARLSPAQRETLTAQVQALDNEVLRLASRLQDRQATLEVEQAKQITTQSYEQLITKQHDYSLRQQQLHESVVQLSYQLKKNTEARIQVEAKQVAIKAQQKECLKWEQLHALIGSADGKKYRNFAQGLTFELMVQQANQQLEKMTDRYLLEHDTNQPLHLDVIDNYQAGERRSTKNLSGGESFIVSLSLALGLSKMASQKVRVDSLFLDEGFGTLDEEALDTALGTLAGLQQEGKLIGVISHVPALKERIATQIRVTPGQGGRSQITGPGCFLSV